MRRRADLDKEIIRENMLTRKAVKEIHDGVYAWAKPKDRAKRDAHIMELWEMGWSRKDIAEAMGLSPVRVSQIVNDFGATFR